MPAVARTGEHNNRTITLRDDQLTARHHLLVEYMLHGCPHASLCERVQIPGGYDPNTGAALLRHPHPGEPLDAIAAGAILHLRRRNVRALQSQPAFQRLLARETQAFRDGARARAVRRMVSLVDEPGQGKAADRKVQLTAALAVLGEAGNTTNVHLNATVNTQITAGIVIDLRDDDEPHTRTVEHEA